MDQSTLIDTMLQVLKDDPEITDLAQREADRIVCEAMQRTTFDAAPVEYERLIANMTVERIVLETRQRRELERLFGLPSPY